MSSIHQSQITNCFHQWLWAVSNFQVTEEIEGTRFNTGISAMMEFLNVAYKVRLNQFATECTSLLVSNLVIVQWICCFIILLVVLQTFSQWDKHPRSIIEAFVLLLSPYAPHMAEELWSRLGHSESSAYEPFPKVLDPFLFSLDYSVSSMSDYLRCPRILFQTTKTKKILVFCSF